jgi:hypothetical protein
MVLIGLAITARGALSVAAEPAIAFVYDTGFPDLIIHCHALPCHRNPADG